MAYNVTLIRGDGTGPELVEATRRVLEATGVQFSWDVVEAGVDVMETAGTPLPPNVLESIRKNKVALKGPITTPIGTGFRSVNVALRKELDLYACIRPCKLYEGVRSRFDKVDLVIVRENTEDLYAGVEFPVDSPEAARIIAMGEGKIRQDAAISIKPISRTGTRRIVKSAFDYAIENDRRKVTAVAKANIMKFTDGLFYEVAREVAKEYAGPRRVRRVAGRRDVYAAGAEAGELRRAGDGKPVRRYIVGPVRGAGRWPWRGSGRQHRRRHRTVRGHAWLGAKI